MFFLAQISVFLCEHTCTLEYHVRRAIVKTVTLIKFCNTLKSLHVLNLVRDKHVGSSNVGNTPIQHQLKINALLLSYGKYDELMKNRDLDMSTKFIDVGEV